MKVLYVCMSYSPAIGAPAELRYLASNLASMGHETTVYATNYLTADEDLCPRTEVRDVDGARVHFFRRTWTAKTLVHSPELNQQLRRDVASFDLVHLYGFRSLQTTMAARHARKSAVPYVITGRGTLTYDQGNRPYKRLYDTLVGRSILQGASKCLPFNAYERRQFEAFGVPASKLETIPLGVDPNAFHPLPERGAFREKHGLGNRITALFLGRFHRIKGLDLLVPAVAKALKEVPDLCVCLAGSNDGAQREIEELVAQYRLTEQIRFVGQVRDTEKLQALVDADLLVLPSRYDLFPNAVCEAWACERPVLVCEGCGIADLVAGERLGLVARFDIDDLADKLVAAAGDPAWRAATGARAKAFVGRELDSRQIARRHEQLYLEIMDRHDSRAPLQRDALSRNEPFAGRSPER